MNEILDDIRKERRWFEKSQLILLYHSFRILGTKRPNKHTMQNTADELSLSVGYISEALKLAEHFKEPFAVTREEALRMIK